MLRWLCLGRKQGSVRPARKALHSSEPWNVTVRAGLREREQGAALRAPLPCGPGLTLYPH